MPQGSILGPLLFLIYINDLPDILHEDTLCAIFADDTKIYREIKSQNDVQILQQDVDNLHRWGEKWGLAFNPDKCNTISIGPQVDNTEHAYQMGGILLETFSQIKDLGVMVDNRLKWEIHIDNMIKRSNTKMWLLIRNLGFGAPKIAKQLIYTSMVRSNLEYCSPLWNPHRKFCIEDIERVQRRANNFITSNPRRLSPLHVDYRQRLNLLPLSFRREVLDIIFFLKSYHDKTGYDIRTYLKFADEDAPRATRNAVRGTLLLVKHANRDTNPHFFPSRIARIWNALPENIRASMKTLSENLVIKQTVNPYYYHLLEHHFDPENTCTWVNHCLCARCRVQ